MVLYIEKLICFKVLKNKPLLEKNPSAIDGKQFKKTKQGFLLQSILISGRDSPWSSRINSYPYCESPWNRIEHMIELDLLSQNAQSKDLPFGDGKPYDSMKISTPYDKSGPLARKF